MISRTDKIIFSVIAVLIALTIVFWSDVKTMFAGNEVMAQKEDKKEKKNKKDQGDAKVSPEVRVTQKWDMPSPLKEISGIAWIDNTRFACVQDELGKIFIFNTATNTIEK